MPNEYALNLSKSISMSAQELADEIADIDSSLRRYHHVPMTAHRLAHAANVSAQLASSTTDLTRHLDAMRGRIDQIADDEHCDALSQPIPASERRRLR